MNVSKCLPGAALAASACLAFAPDSFAQSAAESLAAPTLDTRFSRAVAISSQKEYEKRATLLEDMLWSREGAPVLRNLARETYEKADTRRWRVVDLASFASLAGALRETAGVDVRTVDRDVRAPVEIGESGVVLRNGGVQWSCVFASRRCEKYVPIALEGQDVNRPPNGRVGLALEKGNLQLVTKDSSWLLTNDASDRISYGSLSERPQPPGRPRPRVIWSADGRYAAVVRRDQTGVEPAALMEWLPDGEYGRRARHVPFLPRAFFADAHIGTRSLYIVDTVERRMMPVPDSASRVIKGDPVVSRDLQFAADNHHVYFTNTSDDFRSVRLIEFDTHTGTSRTVLTEQSADGGFVLPDGRYGGDGLGFHVLTDRKAVAWYSERDGFGHLYLYALDSGRLIRQLTRGEWTVLALYGARGKTLYFSGTTPQTGKEPYNRQLYSVDIDSGALDRYTDPEADHAFSWSPDRKVLVQSSATIDRPAELSIRRLDELKRAPLRVGPSSAESLPAVRATGFQGPRRFKVQSTVGGRWVYGTIYRPSWVTPGQVLPVIEKIYPGNCCVLSPWSFPHSRTGDGGMGLARFFEPQALAELGFVVVISAGPGSPLRGRAYHQAQRGEGYWDADSLETHIDVLRQLAREHREMDLSRVGIYGQSGGGYAAARAILKYPDFYDVAVAMAGNHDRRLYNAGWPAFYAGEDPNGPDARNGPETVTLAGNLRGHLLLMHGDVDTSVLIDGTMQLAAALQRARKKFDMQVIVGAGHGIDDMDEVQRYYWSYFLEHLRDEKTGVDLASPAAALTAVPSVEKPDPVKEYFAQVESEEMVRIPMRDGTRLNASLFFAKNRERRNLPTVLTFYPYRIDPVSKESQALLENGYALAYVNSRGRYFSEGVYSFLIGSGADSYDTIEWLSKQPWSNGKVGALGCSSSAEEQHKMNAMHHPAFRAAVPKSAGAGIGRVGPYNEMGNFYRGGVMQNMWFTWYHRSAYKYTPRFPPGLSHEQMLRLGRFWSLDPEVVPKVDWSKTLWTLPVSRIPAAAGSPPSDLDEFMSWAPNDPRWNTVEFASEGDRNGSPALYINAWYDMSIAPNLAMFEYQTRNAANAVARDNTFMIIAPTTHCRMGRMETERTVVGERDMGDARFDYTGFIVRWFDHWLKGIDNGVTREPKVRVYTMGENRWRAYDTWPPREATPVTYYLDSKGGANTLNGNGRLTKAPTRRAARDTYVYDPLNPTPSLGGQACCFASPNVARAGPFDQTPVQSREDVLVYTSDVLDAPVEVTGNIPVTLYLSSDAKDTDLMVRLVDVHPDGKAYNLDEQALRVRWREGYEKPVFMQPGQIYKVSIPPLVTSNTFLAGHRIRLAISSSSFPIYGRNLNTGGNNYDEKDPVIAHNAIHHGPQHPSAIVLPVIPSRREANR